MIEGLKVTIEGKELAELAGKRAKEFNDKAVALADKLGTIDELSSPSKSFNPGDEARNKIEAYKSQAAELQFIADHVDMNESFLLSRSDLNTLGITYNRF